MEYTNLKQNEEKANKQIDNDSDFTEDQPVIEQIFDKAGYNWKIWRVFLQCFSIVIIGGIELSVFSQLIIPLTAYFNMTTLTIQIVSSLMFVGIAIGSLLTGNISKIYPRRIILKVCLFFLLITHIIMGLCSNLALFAFFRFLSGILMGSITPLTLNTLAEYLPIRYRGLFLTSVNIGFGVGIFICSLVMMMVMPNLETSNIKIVFMLLAVIISIIFLFIFLFFGDSPRNLILRKFEDEGIEILENIYQKQLKICDKSRILKEVKYNTIVAESNMRELFSTKLIKTTILSSFIALISALAFYGPNLTSSLTMKGLNIKKSIPSNHTIVVNLLIASLPSMPITFIGGVITEIKVFGRKNTMISGYGLAALFFLFSCAFSSQFPIMLGMATFCVFITFTVQATYISEFYPTQIRDFGFGFIYFFSKLGGIISQILYIYLNSIYLFCPYIFTASILVVGIILIVLLPIETYGIPLDGDHSSKLNKQNLEEDLKS